MSRIVFRFSFDRKHHADVISILESVPKSMRTAFVVEAIRFVSSRLVEIPFRNMSNRTEEEKKTPDSPEPEQRESQGKRFSVDLSKLLGGGN